MARRERTHRAENGTRVPSVSRDFVMANESMFSRYHEERRDIDKRYPLFVPGFTVGERETMAMLRRAAREELREHVKVEVTTLGYAGPYLIPV